MSRRRQPIRDEADALAYLAGELAVCFARSSGAAAAAVALVVMFAALELPGDLFGYWVVVGVSLAGGYAALSTWRELQRVRRHAVLLHGVQQQRVLFAHVHGPRHRRGFTAARTGASPSKEARAGPHGG